jgi:hypothetical protein
LTVRIRAGTVPRALAAAAPTIIEEETPMAAKKPVKKAVAKKGVAKKGVAKKAVAKKAMAKKGSRRC